MTTSHNASAADMAELAIVSTRVFSAPRERVFRAFSDPAHLAKWWGPEGFSNTFAEFEFRVGGPWRFVMHGPDGTDYPNHSVFDEIVAPERIVFRHLDAIHEFQMTIDFAALGALTRMTWRMQHESAEKCAQVRSFVVPAIEQNFDKLERELVKMAADHPDGGCPSALEPRAALP